MAGAEARLVLRNTAVLVRRVRSTVLHIRRDVRRMTEALPSKTLVPELRSSVCDGVAEQTELPASLAVRILSVRKCII